jgi:hypothetical protein
MEPARPSLHRISLEGSAERIPLDHCAMLRWSVLGVEASVSSVHLALSVDNSPCMIVSVPEEGSQEVIFKRPGWFTFTLTATFGDGIKCRSEISVQVIG